MQKIPQKFPGWWRRFTSILLIAVVPMLGVFQVIGIKYQRHLTKQCIFNQMESQDLESVFLDEQQFEEPKPGSEFWLNGNKYDAIRVTATAGGWSVMALNDKVEKLAEQAMRAENAVPMHPSAKKYTPYNKNWQIRGLVFAAVLSGEYSFKYPIFTIGPLDSEMNSVFQPPELRA